MNDMKFADPTWAWQPFEPTADRPWDRSLVSHLYRRAGFGADLPSIEKAIDRSPADVVNELVASNREQSDFRATADALANATLAGGDPAKLSAAWVYRLLYTPNQVLEKLTLFWHGHFATGAEKVKDARMMWNQNQLLREHALGNFGDLAMKISHDPAMLIYLDSAINRKAHPNENFARELMELFCLGEGNYSEKDVLELARCFTGWEIKNKKFRKNRYQHDSKEKSVLGQSGNFDGEDGVRIVLEQPAAPKFIARKLYRFFVCDEPRPTDAMLQPLADLLREHDFEVAPVIARILGSNIFYSTNSVGRKIKSPVELVIGTLRCLNATTNTQRVAKGLRNIGQGLFYPPNVKGWDGGRAWINSSTLLGRANLVADILDSNTTRFDGKSLSEYLHTQNVRTTDQAIEHFEVCLLAVRLDEATKAQLRKTTAAHTGDKERQMRSLLHAVTSLPVCQLA
ncbi:hypothetical protein FF011L_53460 [Roseimaritima multifibrata]|uniref:DUF1800 domain-containing protein n=1 Tax=Roseimaritima multifibrata TaxID=1930274 RepID=A0A517MNT2_9BACT|nr:DUF1800 domain-containing protein [Roseimaritima multifibrata]QDS96534.1 hypothetical protein FF011L_53460 [Roseimaritima multifibrata]